ncbi:hypothetical protein, partial [Pseudomonas avellanae]|uniref:hypothetical protein n=1 Tax=Pseudomonas avellanae TaxID=46257 RepID=UPI001CA4F67D
NDELADIKLEGCIEFSVFLGHGDSSMDIVSPIKVSGVIRPAQTARLIPQCSNNATNAWESSSRQSKLNEPIFRSPKQIQVRMDGSMGRQFRSTILRDIFTGPQRHPPHKTQTADQPNSQ